MAVRELRFGIPLERIRDLVREDARGLGVEVADVRIKRADLPAANSEAIYRRMQTARQLEAAEIRAQGSEIAQKIRAGADRAKVEILASAERKGKILRGEGEGETNRISREAYGRDPEFYAFYRSLQTYETALQGDNTTMVLSPDSEFFRYFFENVQTPSPDN